MNNCRFKFIFLAILMKNSVHTYKLENTYQNLISDVLVSDPISNYLSSDDNLLKEDEYSISDTYRAYLSSLDSTEASQGNFLSSLFENPPSQAGKIYQILKMLRNKLNQVADEYLSEKAHTETSQKHHQKRAAPSLDYNGWTPIETGNGTSLVSSQDMADVLKFLQKVHAKWDTVKPSNNQQNQSQLLDQLAYFQDAYINADLKESSYLSNQVDQSSKDHAGSRQDLIQLMEAENPNDGASEAIEEQLKQLMPLIPFDVQQSVPVRIALDALLFSLALQPFARELFTETLDFLNNPQRDPARNSAFLLWIPFGMMGIAALTSPTVIGYFTG